LIMHSATNQNSI